MSTLLPRCCQLAQLPPSAPSHACPSPLPSLRYDTTENVELHINDKVSSIDTDAKIVTSEKGRAIPYDAVVLATGSYPFVPPNMDTNQPGVFVYRTIDDLERMIAYQKVGQGGVVSKIVVMVRAGGQRNAAHAIT